MARRQGVYKVVRPVIGRHHEVDVGFLAVKEGRRAPFDIFAVLALEHGIGPDFFRLFLCGTGNGAPRKHGEPEFRGVGIGDCPRSGDGQEAGKMFDCLRIGIELPLFLVERPHGQKPEDYPGSQPGTRLRGKEAARDNEEHRRAYEAVPKRDAVGEPPIVG